MTALAKKVFELFGKPALAGEPTSPGTEKRAVASWPCPSCGGPASIADVFSSLDGERMLTMWSCDPCQVVAVTPDSIQKPPTAWIRKITQ